MSPMILKRKPIEFNAQADLINVNPSSWLYGEESPILAKKVAIKNIILLNINKIEI